MTDYLIRLETDSDLEGIEELHLQAFPSPLEARLVRQLREEGDAVFSMTAVEGAGCYRTCSILETAQTGWRLGSGSGCSHGMQATTGDRRQVDRGRAGKGKG